MGFGGETCTCFWPLWIYLLQELASYKHCEQGLSEVQSLSSIYQYLQLGTAHEDEKFIKHILF